MKRIIAMSVLRLTREPYGWPLTGTLHSVFSHSCNLHLGERLVTVAAGAELLPDSIRTTRTEFERIAAYPLGTPATLEREALNCGEESIPLIRDGWTGRMTVGTLRASAILSELERFQLPPLPLPEWAIEALFRAARRLRDNRLPEARRECLRFIGLGQGLTPSADDALLGILAARSRKGERQPFLGEELPARTTLVSAKYLRCAQEGFFSERVKAVLETGAGLSEAIRRAARWGASSGTDMLGGLRIACQAELEIRRDTNGKYI